MDLIIRKFISDACAQAGYQLLPVDAEHDLFTITDGATSIPYMMGYLPLNRHMAVHIAHNKHLTCQILSHAGISIPATVKLPNTVQEENEIKRRIGGQFTKTDYPLFVKPGNGSQGMGIALATNEAQLLSHIRWLHKKYNDVLVQEYIDAPEYRMVVLAGKPQYVYRRIPGQVCGDGKKTFEELIAALKEKSTLDFDIGLDRGFIFEQMLAMDANWKTVIPKGAVIRLSPGVSFRSGRSFSDVCFTTPSSWQDWIENIDSTMGLRFYSIDFFMCGDYEDSSNFIVIEINSNPRFTFLEQTPWRDAAIDIWTKILDIYITEAKAKQQRR